MIIRNISSKNIKPRKSGFFILLFIGNGDKILSLFFCLFGEEVKNFKKKFAKESEL
jgi:hypothetical protein